MMRFRIILIALALFSSKNNAQKNNGQKLDTLNYLKQFETNKVNYIGQPFSKLLNDITKIQFKTVWSHSPFNNKKIISDTDFKFVEKEYSFGKVVTLFIEWQNPFSKNDAIYYKNLN